MRKPKLAALLALAAACAAPGGAVRRTPPPAADQGGLLVTLDPLAPEAARLSFEIGSVSAVAASGAVIPLEVRAGAIRGGGPPGQRLVALGGLAPGSYAALLIGFRRATLDAEPRPADLLLPPGPIRAAASFRVERQRSAVAVLSVRIPRLGDGAVAFEPSIAASIPGAAVEQVAAYCSLPGRDEVAILDKNTRRLVGAISVGREPRGMALDPRLPRLYVALSGEDRIAVLDVIAGEVLTRIPLRPGDGPAELAATPDGRLLLVVNSGSNTVSFLDPSSAVELGRVDAGEEPGPLLLEPGGRRAYVLNRRSSSITVVDVANRAVAATLRTDAEPVRARVNRAGTRLYVVHAGSLDLAVFSLPGLQAVKRVHVGLGASALAVSPRTDLIYVGRRDAERLQIFDPLSFFPLSSLGLAAPASYLAIDDVQEVLFALQPYRSAVEAVDLMGGRTLATVELADQPYQIVLAGERR